MKENSMKHKEKYNDILTKNGIMNKNKNRIKNRIMNKNKNMF